MEGVEQAPQTYKIVVAPPHDNQKCHQILPSVPRKREGDRVVGNDCLKLRGFAVVELTKVLDSNRQSFESQLPHL